MVVGLLTLLGGTACSDASGGPRAQQASTSTTTVPARAGLTTPNSPAVTTTPRTPAAPPHPPPPPPTLPGGGRTLFPGHRIVAYYGAAGTAALGVLGSGPPEQVWSRLAAVAGGFRQPAARPLPTFELISVVANAGPGPDGKYRTRISDEAIDRYHAVVRRHGGLLLLDIQPGQADFLTEAIRLAPWLREPDVALAIDPEWRMGADGVPGRRIGSVDAAEVNAVSAWLDRLTVRYRLPQKLMLVHQFTTGMIHNKPAIQLRPHLAMVFNMDGFGGRAAKLAKYRMLAADHRFGLGLKLFYRQDISIFRPCDVLALHPAPRVIEYQ